MNTIILMYHAIYRNEAELASLIATEDRPYAVSRESFQRQLSMVVDQLAKDKRRDIIISFDDGHISNHSIALPELEKYGLKAIFFITTDFMRERPYFCRPEQIKSLYEAGMEIGSHGASHCFLDDDLSREELLSEFADSKSALEEATGSPVVSISFPGGRYSRDSVSLACGCGFSRFYGSRAGINDNLGTDEASPLRRVAIRRTTSDSEFLQIISANGSYYSKIAVKQALKSGLRKLLGNRLYHGLYKSVSG